MRPSSSLSVPSSPITVLAVLALLLIGGLARPLWSAEPAEPRLELAELPFPVRDTVISVVAGKKLQDILLLTDDGARIYQVTYRDGSGQLQTARVDGNGRLLVDGATPGTPSRSPSSVGIPLTSAPAVPPATTTPSAVTSLTVGTPAAGGAPAAGGTTRSTP